MCQLLGMNSNTPTDVTFSFTGFAQRAGHTGDHCDGWGIAFFEDKGVRHFVDHQRAVDSPIADLIRRYPIHSRNVIAHIRKATQGTTSLANTHPFIRELWGEYWMFAHNGHLENFHPPRGQYYRPVGTTDSERAFCFILEELRQRFDEKPDTATLFATVSSLVQQIRGHGLFNCLMSNGDWMFAHASTLLYYIVRQAPFGEAHLLDDDVAIDFSSVTTPKDRVAVIATLPLTGNESWQQLACDELVLFENGSIIQRDRPAQPRYLTEEEGLAIARSVGVVA